ncbi:unnamed protein product [Clonostachys solani]|uniref:NmrA-like domain-containing protein n=1 Tax=Clonostachys solani TaxID=160281 RepID=A0A9N9YYY5_9HYPO|nr:unnamed protein product [Clonostachys solani]
MVNVAIAGGTGGVGRSIVDALKANGGHNVTILSRKVSEDVNGYPVIAVDYDDIDGLRTTLEQHRIHTVISALAMHIIGVGKSQLNLIEAADKSMFTKRFVVSNWAVRPNFQYMDLLPHGFQHITCYEALPKTSLEWTAFNCGWFLEYYAMPNVETYIPQTTFVVDMAGLQAAIPGDGKQKMTFTYTKDAARFVVAALGLPKWEQNTYIIGDKMTWEEFVQVAERARGRTWTAHLISLKTGTDKSLVKGKKFTVTYDSVEELKAGKITELPGQIAAYPYFRKEWVQRLFSVFGFWVTEGLFDLPDDKALHNVFPDIRATTIEEMLTQAWKGQ